MCCRRRLTSLRRVSLPSSEKEVACQEHEQRCEGLSAKATELRVKNSSLKHQVDTARLRVKGKRAPRSAEALDARPRVLSSVAFSPCLAVSPPRANSRGHRRRQRG